MAYYTDVYLNYKPTQRVLDKIHAKPLTSVAHHPPIIPPPTLHITQLIYRISDSYLLHSICYHPFAIAR